MQVCPQCQRDRLVNNGSAAGKPQKRCQPCGDQLTRTTPRGKPLAMKGHAVLLYLSGLSMHRIAFLVRGSAQSGLNGVRAFAVVYDEKPEATGGTLVLERDEMWHDVKKQQQKRWIWTALDQETGQLPDWACGRRNKATLKPMVDRLAQWDITLYGTHQGATSASVIPQDKLVQSKATTHAIERHHGRQRQWFGRFTRQSIIVSKSTEMVDLTMVLFAKFWVNGNQDELLSRLD